MRVAQPPVERADARVVGRLEPAQRAGARRVIRDQVAVRGCGGAAMSAASAAVRRAARLLRGRGGRARARGAERGERVGVLVGVVDARDEEVLNLGTTRRVRIPSRHQNV